MKTKATITIEKSSKSYDYDLKVKKKNGKQNICWSLRTFIHTYFPSFHDVLVIVLTIVIVGLLGLLSLFIAYLF